MVVMVQDLFRGFRAFAVRHGERGQVHTGESGPRQTILYYNVFKYIYVLRSRDRGDVARVRRTVAQFTQYCI